MFRSTQQLIGKFGMDLGATPNTAPSSYSFSSGSLLTVRASDILTVSGAVSISIPKITIIGTVSFANNCFDCR
jgi:hypothetical protein